MHIIKTYKILLFFALNLFIQGVFVIKIAYTMGNYP